VHTLKYWLWMITVVTLSLILLCGCDPQPAYYTPYGEGVDPNTVTTGEYIRKPTVTTTGLVIVSTTKPPVTTVPTRLAAPLAGHVVCPTCDGIMKPCIYCGGTLYRQGEMLDLDSGIFRKYKMRCNMCDKDPGYEICETCQNKLLIPAE